MRKMGFAPIACYMFLQLIALALTGLVVGGLLWPLPLGDFRGIVLILSVMALFCAFTIACYRAFLFFVPLAEGPANPGTREEFAAHVHFLFFLMVFNSLVRTNFIPAPLMRQVYRALGTRMGDNTYSVGALLDPALTVLGSNVMIGHNATLFAHAIEGDALSFGKIVTGDNVTIGAGALVMPGVEIGDGAVVSAGAVVRKNTKIGSGEIWGGVPARLLKSSVPAPSRQSARDLSFVRGIVPS